MAGITWDLYCRLSVAPDGSTETVERQEADMRRAIERDGDRVGGVYCDNNLSAWKRNVRRPQFEALLERIERGESTHVMVWHMDRYVRQVWDLVRLIRAAEDGVIIRSLYSGDIDLSNSDHRAQAINAANWAEKSSADTSRRVKGKIDARVRSGKPLGGRTYGYRPDGTIVEAEAEVIREAAHRYIAGEAWPDIAADFAKRGIVTVGEKTAKGKARKRGGVPFTRTSLRTMVLRERNGGEITRRGQVVGRMPAAILDEDTYADLHARAAGQRHGRRPDPRFPLTGLITCTACGGTKRGATLRDAKGRMADGRPRRVYRCVPSDNGQHCAKSVTAEYVEKIVYARVRAALADRRRADAVLPADPEAEALTARIERTGRSLTDLAVNYAEGNVPEADYDRVRARLTATLTAARARLAEVTSAEHQEAAAATVTRREWDAADDEERRRLVRRVVRRITVAPDKRTTIVGRAFDPDRVGVELIPVKQRSAAESAVA
jgi:site-specific DNA recombinase